MTTQTLAPTTMGHADVNGQHLYVETYGTGAPLVLLHGGMLSIDLDFGALLPGLAETRTVVGIELQGHGRSPDSERDITYANHAADVVAVLDHLGHERAAVMGHSMGGGVALELAVHHPDRVASVVAVSASVRPDGLHPDLGDPSTYATSTIMPTAEDFAAMRGMITRDGTPVARLEPLPAAGLGAAALVARLARLPPVDGDRLCRDVDVAVDQSL